MKIRLLTQYANAERSIAPGQTAEVPDAEAKQLIEGGYAVSAEPKVKEVAVAQEAPERATKK